LRQSIAKKDCYCTNEVFLWPSITYQPAKLVQAMIGAKVWQTAEPLAQSEKLPVDLNAAPSVAEPGSLVNIQRADSEA
jgi:hypothetical protein